eukprot:scaffold40870_cov60-Phaeocystis_antarctica.AAC.6
MPNPHAIDSPLQMKSTGHTLPSGMLTSQRRTFTPASAPASIARCVASGSIYSVGGHEVSVGAHVRRWVSPTWRQGAGGL